MYLILRLKDENDQWGPLYKHAIVNHNASTTPEITVTGTLTQFTACGGSVSAEQNFVVQGENLLSGISISAPTGYEISLTPGNNYGTNININNSGGTVSQTTVYVRLKSNANNGSSGTVSLTSSGAQTQNVSTGTAIVNTPPNARINIWKYLAKYRVHCYYVNRWRCWWDMGFCKSFSGNY